MSAADSSGGGGGTAMMTVHEGTSQHRTFQAVGWGALVLIGLAVPYLLPNFRVTQVAQALAFALALLGINMALGYGGLLSIGHIAFMGLGAYTTTILINDYRWDLWMTLPAAAFFCFLFGVGVGLPALKIRGLYLALVTFALSYTFPILLKIDDFGISRRTGGDNGKTLVEQVRPPDWAKSLLFINNKNPQQQIAIYQYFIVVLTCAVVFLLIRNILKSRPGRAVVAIRDNQIGAAVSGVNLNQTKVLNFGISAAVTGIGGSMLAMNLNSVGPTSFDANYAILTLLGLVLGGVATLHGCWVGGLLLVFIQDFAPRIIGWLPGNIPVEYARAVFGIILVLVAFFAPGGVVGMARKVKTRMIRVIPKPPEPVDVVATPPAPVGEERLSGASMR
jgi:branched-chain amino acid transport system permease protein